MQLQEDIYTSGGVQTHTLPPNVGNRNDRQRIKSKPL